MATLTSAVDIFCRSQIKALTWLQRLVGLHLTSFPTIMFKDLGAASFARIA